MAAKKSEALEFTRNYLRDKPDASFAEIRDAAAEREMKIYPIVFGRAKALEGLVKVAPYGSKKRAREAAKAAAAAGSSDDGAPGEIAGRENAGPEVAARKAGTVSASSIESMISGMRENHQDRERYRAALIKIGEILDDIL